MKTSENSWDEADVELLKRVWSQGKSVTVIAGMLRRTRNAIVGKVHRLKLGTHKTYERKDHPLPKPRIAASTKNTTPTRHRSTATKATDAPLNAYLHSGAPSVPLPVFAHPETALVPGGIDFMELTDHTCKFALTENTPHRFCGMPTEHGSWCPAHRKRVFTNVARMA